MRTVVVVEGEVFGEITDYFLTDALGSVRQLTDAQGEITRTNAYEPYGVLAQTVGNAQTNYGFTGEYTDASGLVYLRARYYASDTGRFITRDPWSGFDNSSLSQNKYIYGFSNPITYTDSGGNNPCLAALALIGVDGPIPAGDLAALYICLRYLATIGLGLTSVNYVANGPEIPGIPRERVIPEIIPLDQILETCWIVIRPNPTPSPKSDPWKVPFPLKIPLATQTPEPKPEYIYRDGRDRPKTVRLYKPEDYKTGLSFWDRPVVVPNIKFKVTTLEANGYIVKRDGGQFATQLPFFGGGQPFALPVTLPEGHVTVYHHDGQYWQEWYTAELKNTNTSNISPQTLALYALRER